MCGIVGLYLKNPQLESRLGQLFEPMLQAMTDRGPDSAGFAIYGDEVADGWVKLTLQATSESFDWSALMGALEGRLGCSLDWFQNASAAVLKIHAEEAPVRLALAELAPGVRIMSAGQSIEILKGMGLPQEISQRFGLAGMQGSHIIGHTRMATESAVTMEGSHPFSTGADLCLVHNGSLSNHFRLRQELKREGIKFETDNDTEVAAGYLTPAARRLVERGAGPCTGGSRRFLHLRHRHPQRLCGDPRPDRLQAGDPRRDRRLRGHGLGVSGAVEPAGH